MKCVFKVCLTVLMFASVAFSVSACGKISSPEPIENSGYPHSYPRR